MRFAPLMLAASFAIAVHAQDVPAPLCDFSTPPTYAFLGWEGKPSLVEGGGLRLQTRDGKGGFGYVVERNLTDYADYTPVVTLTLGAENQARTVRLALQDADGTEASFHLRLVGLEPGVAHEVAAAEGASLANPASVGNKNKKDAVLDLARLTGVVIVGDWTPRAVDVTFRRVALTPPTPELLEAREKLQQRLVREAEQKRLAAEREAQRKATLLADSPHPEDGAQVVNIATVAPDLLGIEIQSGTFVPGDRVAYEPLPGDVVSGGRTGWVVRAGQMVEEPLGRIVERPGDKGRKVKLGTLAHSGKWLMRPSDVSGTLLDTITIDEPAAYAIASDGDPAYAQPLAPLAVHRKSKPNSPGAGNRYAISHRLYLKLPSPLREGAVYTVRFRGVNTREKDVAYTNDTRRVRSDAVHATHLGYRADDPFKRGFLSVWLGTGGAYQHSDVARFELIDAATGKSVFEGRPVQGRSMEPPADPKYDYSLTAVWQLDFSAFRTPGTYRLHVPGVGCSYPFRIGDDVWLEAFRLGMRGVLSQRSGIDLGPPFLEFTRPRAHHPDDGVKFYQINVNSAKKQEGGRGEDLLSIWKEKGQLEEVKGVWGGYQDAGDWDVYSTTLHTADLLLEAFEIAPEQHGKIKLSLPTDESADSIPDLLNEALWGLAAFRRLQLPTGAVRAGFGDGWGARGGDVSWDNSNPVCVYGPAQDISWYYAAVAARMARTLAPFDAAQAKAYGESAVRAWQWAGAREQPAADGAAPEPGSAVWLRGHAKEAAAAVALYQLTREAAYHDRYKAICETSKPVDTAYKGGWVEPLQQGEATFAYARLPDDLADAELKRNARDLYVLAGNVAVAYMQGNPYNLATVNPGYPMGEFCAYFTMAGMGPQIVRAHALTGDPRYLEAVVASTGFGLGANPDNLCFTTGLGPNPVRFPLHLDSLRTGQEAPVGITVYGPSDQRTPRAWSKWVYQWVLPPTRMVPGVHTWPPAESYVDVFAWPAVNEYCVNAPLTTTVYSWCYLATRPDGVAP